MKRIAQITSMNKPSVLLLTQEAWNEISRHAQETFPEECCGVVLSAAGLDYVHRLKNIQNKLHALDPLTYPRTAAIAYAMDPLELESVIAKGEARSHQLKAFYHSHPEHDAYFSDEDKAFASPFGEPTYPESAQIVISIYNRAVKIIRAFAWSDENNDFVEVPIDRTESHVGST
jgi:[CysO sulfur-carrier protein]-S-L-cysteine hydrolase